MSTTNCELYPKRSEAPRGRALHRVNFFCDAKKAAQVHLAGDFNHWDAAHTPMKQMPDGRWMASLELPHGHHQYVFLVDGTPQLDPAAAGVIRNADGKLVCLVAVS